MKTTTPEEKVTYYIRSQDYARAAAALRGLLVERQVEATLETLAQELDLCAEKWRKETASGL